MTSADAAVLARLQAALIGVGDALACADLDRLLAAEPEVASALEAVARVRPQVPDPEMRQAIDAGRAALLRCRRLGAALVEFTRISLDPFGEAVYSRAGLAPAPDRGALASAVSLGTTLEARG